MMESLPTMKLRSQIKRILRDIQSEDEDIQTYAAMSVLRLKEVSIDEIQVLLPPLRTATSNDSISVRFFSRKALNEIKIQMAKYPSFREEYEKLKSENTICSWSALLGNLKNEDTNAKLAILDYLRDIDDPLLPEALHEFVRGETDAFVLAEAIKVLGIVGNKESVDFLEELLSHTDSRIRSNAVEAMAEIGGQQVMRSILPLLEDDDNRVKATVAKICSQHGEHQVVATLETMLHSVEIWMRESATYALGYVPCSESVNLLLEAICDVNPEIQIKAIEALGKLRAKKAREYLHAIEISASSEATPIIHKALKMIANDPQEYSYYSLEKENNPDKLSQNQSFNTTRKVSFPRTDSAAQGSQASMTSKLSLTTKVTNLLSSSPHQKEDDSGELALTIEERGLLCEKLGQLIIDAYRNEKVTVEYIQPFSNEEKKLKYLIEQKESQRNKMQEDSSKSTFLSFIKESVSRFTSEKQVDSRMISLMKQLKSNYRHLGEKISRDSSLRLDNVQYDDLPMKIEKLERRIIALQKQLDS
jgi:HEAT repeat protein